MDRRLLLGAAFILCAAGIFGLLNRSSEPEPVPIADITQDEIAVWLARVPLKKGTRSVVST